jgi:hypothetical protein
MVPLAHGARNAIQLHLTLGVTALCGSALHLRRIGSHVV